MCRTHSNLASEAIVSAAANKSHNDSDTIARRFRCESSRRHNEKFHEGTCCVLPVILLCATTLVQEPVVDIDKAFHPNLAEAQRFVVEANRYVALAQKDNRYDMKDHAEKARFVGTGSTTS